MEFPLLFASLNGESIVGANGQRSQPYAPFATVVCHCHKLLSGNAYRHILPRVGGAVDVERRVALQHHVVGIDTRQLQASIVARDASIHCLRQDASPFGIRMNGIGQQVGIWIERGMEIYQFRPTNPCHGLDGLLYLVVPTLGARHEPWVTVSDGRHASQDKAHLGVGGAQGVHQREIVSHELITIVGPIAWVCVVDAQVDHGYVALESHGLPELLLPYVWSMPMIQQRGTRFAEIAHFILVAQHLLKLYRIGEMLPVLDARAVGDAVAHASHLDFPHCLLAGCRRCKATRRKQQHGQCSHTYSKSF